MRALVSARCPRAEAPAQQPAVGLLAGQTLVGPRPEADPVNAAMAGSPLPRGDLPGPRVLGFLGAARVRARGGKVVATGGCFGLLHAARSGSAQQAAMLAGLVAELRPAGEPRAD